jgi:threonine dehydratase
VKGQASLKDNTSVKMAMAPDWATIVTAHARIAPRIHRTPVLTSNSLDAIAGARLFFKCDNFQKTGSFKIRGASNTILSISDQEISHGIVTLSSGNHGAAVACAARWRGVPAYIVMPRNAPKVKCQAVEDYLLRAQGFGAGGSCGSRTGGNRRGAGASL